MLVASLQVRRGGVRDMGLFVNACCLAAGEKIPPGATLVFEVELLAIEDGEPPKNIFKEIDVDGDNRLSKDEVSSTPGLIGGGMRRGR